MAHGYTGAPSRRSLPTLLLTLTAVSTACLARPSGRAVSTWPAPSEASLIQAITRSAVQIGMAPGTTDHHDEYIVAHRDVEVAHIGCSLGPLVRDKTVGGLQVSCPRQPSPAPVVVGSHSGRFTLLVATTRTSVTEYRVQAEVQRPSSSFGGPLSRHIVDRFMQALTSELRGETHAPLFIDWERVMCIAPATNDPHGCPT